MLESLKQFNGQLGEGATLSANIKNLTPKEISRGIINFVQDKRLGIGRGFHKGKGWDSKGISPQPRAPARPLLALLACGGHTVPVRALAVHCLWGHCLCGPGRKRLSAPGSPCAAG